METPARNPPDRRQPKETAMNHHQRLLPRIVVILTVKVKIIFGPKQERGRFREGLALSFGEADRPQPAPSGARCDRNSSAQARQEKVSACARQAARSPASAARAAVRRSGSTAPMRAGARPSTSRGPVTG